MPEAHRSIEARCLSSLLFHFQSYPAGCRATIRFPWPIRCIYIYVNIMLQLLHHVLCPYCQLPTLRALTLLSGMQTEHCSGVSTSNRSQTFQILSNSQSTLAALALQAWHSNSRIVSCMDWKRQHVICSPHVLMFSRSAGIQVLAVLPFAWRLR